MVEIYYKRPILYDYIFSAIVVVTIFLLKENYILKKTDLNRSLEFASDIGTVGLTVSGFILTLLTILLTLKSGQIITDEKLTNHSSPFKIFLESPMYEKSVDILRNGVLSLIIICFIIFFLKLVFSIDAVEIIHYLSIVGLIIIITTFLRCFYVLDMILKMQKKSKKE